MAARRVCSMARGPSLLAQAALVGLIHLILTAAPRLAGAADVFLGAAACASGVCHGSIVARQGARVAQNEYHIWSQRDAHARAYETLTGERSRAIAGRLGLGAAESAEVCLACHALDVPAAAAVGPKFQISDGVSCEACHGAAGAWIEMHEDAAATHEDNVKRGMNALEDPQVRAGVCVACHQGSHDRAVTHRLMAAGHPRLSFELDTFTYLQPAHFRVDADYRERKRTADSASVWATGQAASVVAYASVLAGPNAARTGLWPEFSLFDCFGCHHSIGMLPTTGVGGQPTLGLPTLGSSSFILYRELTAQITPEKVAELDGDIAALHSSAGTDRERFVSVASGIAERARAAARAFSTLELDRQQLDALIKRLTSGTIATRYRTYADAEQATMALQALVATLAERRLLEATRAERVQSALDGLFEATSSEESFRASRFAQALAKLQGAL